VKARGAICSSCDGPADGGASTTQTGDSSARDDGDAGATTGAHLATLGATAAGGVPGIDRAACRRRRIA